MTRSEDRRWRASIVMYASLQGSRRELRTSWCRRTGTCTARPL